MSQESVLPGRAVALREEPKKRSASKRAWRMLRRGRLGLAGCIILFGVIFAAITAPDHRAARPHRSGSSRAPDLPGVYLVPALRRGAAQTIHGSTDPSPRHR